MGNITSLRARNIHTILRKGPYLINVCPVRRFFLMQMWAVFAHWG
jgi:hypothetical protein